MDRHPPNFAQLLKVVDIITCDKYFSDRLRDVDSVGVKNKGFPLTKPVAVNTGRAKVCGRGARGGRRLRSGRP